MKKTLSLLTLAALLLTVVGCGTSSIVSMSDDGQILDPPSRAGGLVADPSSPLPDVPMPVGFVVLRSRSRATVDANGRRVEHVYQGLATMADTADFVTKQLAAHGWQVVSQRSDGPSTIITARNAAEDLRVQLTQPSKIITVRVYVSSHKA